MRFGFGANIAFETATRHDKVWYPLVKLKEASVGGDGLGGHSWVT